MKYIDTSWMVHVRFIRGWRDEYVDLAASIRAQCGGDPYAGELPW